MLQDGFRVFGISRTPPSSAEWGNIDTFHFRHIAADMGETATLHEATRAVVRESGAIYGLVNNAALGLDGLLALQPVSDIERQLRVNLLGPICLTKSVARSMLTKREGRIVNITSIVAQTGYKGLSAYAATKAGLEGFTRSLARELGSSNITVNNIAPGFLRTDMTSNVGEDNLSKITSRAALRKLASPESVAAVVSMLMGPSGEDVTGATYVVDAGAMA
jgi:3-oxoacyl-[acyl-carrier protein] reductase